MAYLNDCFTKPADQKGLLVAKTGVINQQAIIKNKAKIKNNKKVETMRNIAATIDLYSRNGYK